MNNFDTVDDYLEHAGKKGMRWGVRKAKEMGSKIDKASSQPVSVQQVAKSKKVRGAVLGAAAGLTAAYIGQQKGKPMSYLKLSVIGAGAGFMAGRASESAKKTKIADL